MDDIYTVSLGVSVNACTGNTKYNVRADFDNDGCLTSKDLSFIQKMYGKATSAITQCQGITPTPQPTTPPPSESTYKCPDVNGDGTVDMHDLFTVSLIFNACTGDAKYNAKADVDNDGCITSKDHVFLQKMYGKETSAITQCQ